MAENKTVKNPTLKMLKQIIYMEGMLSLFLPEFYPEIVV